MTYKSVPLQPPWTQYQPQWCLRLARAKQWCQQTSSWNVFEALGCFCCFQLSPINLRRQRNKIWNNKQQEFKKKRKNINNMHKIYKIKCSGSIQTTKLTLIEGVYIQKRKKKKHRCRKWRSNERARLTKNTYFTQIEDKKIKIFKLKRSKKSYLKSH